MAASARKIVKEAGASVDELEEQVAQVRIKEYIYRNWEGYWMTKLCH